MDAFTPDPLALIGHRRRWPRNMDTSLSVRPFLPEQGSTNFLGFAISLGVWDSPRLGPATRFFLAAPK